MKILRTASLDSSFTGSYKRKSFFQNKQHAKKYPQAHSQKKPC